MQAREYDFWLGPFSIGVYESGEGSLHSIPVFPGGSPSAPALVSEGGGTGTGSYPSKPRPECDMANPTNARVIGFIRAHSAEASEIEVSTGLNAAFAPAWGAFESGYGGSLKASVNNNFFGLTGSDPLKNNWLGAIECSSDKVGRGFACFEAPGFLTSGYSALFSQSGRYLNAALSAQHAGGDTTQIAGAIARAGFNSEPIDYGGSVKGTYDAIKRREDCP